MLWRTFTLSIFIIKIPSFNYRFVKHISNYNLLFFFFYYQCVYLNQVNGKKKLLKHLEDSRKYNSFTRSSPYILNSLNIPPIFACGLLPRSSFNSPLISTDVKIHGVFMN